MSELSDSLLLGAYLRGDREAFDALYRRYAARVHATAYRLTAHWDDAEDTLQEVFITLAHKAGTIQKRGSLASWIYRTAINQATDCLRRRRVTSSIDEPNAKTAKIIEIQSRRRQDDLEEARHREGLLRRVESLIPLLPRRQAAAFVLRHYQGLRHEAVAAILGCSESASKSHHSLACRKLREWIAQADAAERGQGLEKNEQDLAP